MTKRVLFTLTMPNVGSWNGRWSQEAKPHLLIRSIPEARIAELGIPKSWHYSFGDGWGANVSARVMDIGERCPPKVGDFCGYDWMVNNIIRWGTPKCQCEWRPDPHSGQPGYEGQWERCIYCRSSRRVSQLAEALP